MNTPEQIKTPCEWADITLELDKAEQMGAQDGASIRQGRPDADREDGRHADHEACPARWTTHSPADSQHLPQLHDAGEKRQSLEQHKPESQRKALAMIAAANAPEGHPHTRTHRGDPTATVCGQSDADRGRREQAEACINALPDSSTCRSR